MPKALDLTDKKFGYLTAIKKAPSRSGKTYWICRCECGIEKEIQTSHLTSGAITSCGCKKTETAMSHKINKICVICGKEFIVLIVVQINHYLQANIKKQRKEQ